MYPVIFKETIQVDRLQIILVAKKYIYISLRVATVYQ